MTDRRLLPANDHVAAIELRGEVDAPRYTDGLWQRIATPVVDLLRSPGGPRERQLLYGERVRVLDLRDGLAFLQSARDSYVGYADADALTADAAATHRVSAAATHLYPEPDLKSRECCWLSHGSLLRVMGQTGTWSRTDAGRFVHTGHIAPLEASPADPVATAQLYLGTPYLWGGNSRAGIDCSGLVQAALLAAGVPCPGDSDLQCDALGAALPAGTPPRAGDLYFWEGHVAMAVDSATLIHANAHHMAVAFEPIEGAMSRIAAKEFGGLVAHKRLT